MKTVIRDQVAHDPADASQPPTQPVVIEQRPTSTTTTTHREPQGVLSTAVHVVGELLILPFRLVGGLIRLVF